jgi:hypothetical protein
LKTGGQRRTSRGAVKFCRAAKPSGSKDFAEIAVRIPRKTALMSSALAGMRKYTAAGIVEDKA